MKLLVITWFGNVPIQHFTFRKRNSKHLKDLL